MVGVGRPWGPEPVGRDRGLPARQRAGARLAGRGSGARGHPGGLGQCSVVTFAGWLEKGSVRKAGHFQKASPCPNGVERSFVDLFAILIATIAAFEVQCLLVNCFECAFFITPNAYPMGSYC